MIRLGTAASVALASTVIGGAAGAGEFAGVTLHVEQVSDAPGRLYLGESLSLLVTTTNGGQQPVRGRLAEGPYAPAVAFLARRQDGTVVRLDEPYDPHGVAESVNGHWPLIVLPPGQAKRVGARFVLDPSTEQLWLPVGTHEIFVVRRPSEQRPAFELRSNALKVLVVPPPERLRGSFDAYMSSKLGLLEFDPTGRLREEPSALRAADEFIRVHGDTPYGRKVLASLLEGLRVRISTGQATSSEIEVYDRTEKNESIRRGVGLGPRSSQGK
jgi:hypothetical protein